MTDYTNLYFAHPASSSYLLELGFIPSSPKGGEDVYYTYRFPCYFWKRLSGHYVPTLFCTLTLDTSDWHVMVDVKTLQNMFYASFYSQEYGGHQPLLAQIHKRINTKLDELHIIDITEKKKRSKKDDKGRSEENRKSDSRSGKSGKTVLQRRKSKRDTRSRTKVSREDVQKTE